MFPILKRSIYKSPNNNQQTALHQHSMQSFMLIIMQNLQNLCLLSFKEHLTFV